MTARRALMEEAEHGGVVPLRLNWGGYKALSGSPLLGIIFLAERPEGAAAPGEGGGLMNREREPLPPV